MAYSQQERRFSISAPGGDPDLLLFQGMTMREQLSRMYRIQLSMLSEKSDIKFEDMIGQAISIRLRMPEGGNIKERYFDGIVVRFSQGPPSGKLYSYRAEVVPWLWLLTRGSDCRIFQHKNTPDIVKQVFDDLGMSDYKLDLSGTYREHEYCVQYRETHFNFVSRLIEEAGIAYRFEHTDKGHTLILFDDPSKNPEVPFAKSASYATASEEGTPSGEIESWTYEQTLPSGKYAVRDYNFEDPSLDLLSDTPSTISIGGNDRFEIYDYPGEYQDLGTGDAKVKLRMEAEEAASYVIEGHCARGDFSAGCTFDLVGHYRKDFNDKTYLLTAVTHQASQGYGDEGDAASSYSNTFSCIPHDVPYRPIQHTPKPLITGAQTATVVGTSGQEIDVDQHGRVVVKFHWDRDDKRDENSSCRVRVSQNWAGKSWGAIFNPRIGQEVIVEFLEGDPDRPIITGRVYNGEQKVPYDLPANATQSGIKSRSSKSGSADNFNEIRFEDKKGSELLSMQAEKDRETLVKNDERKQVDNDQFLTVSANKTVDVSENHKETVGRDQTIHVKESRQDTVDKDEDREVGENRTRSVGKNETVSIGEDQKLVVDQERSVNIAKDDGLEVGGNLAVAVEKNYGISVTKDYSLDAKKIAIEAQDEITLKTGSASIQMKKNGDITIKGKKITVKGSGDVIVKGSKIKQN